MEKKTLSGLLAFALGVIGLIPLMPQSATAAPSDLPMALVLEYTVPAGDKVTLYEVISDSSRVEIEWGYQGAFSSWSDGVNGTAAVAKNFTFTYPVAGKYTVTISGAIKSMAIGSAAGNPNVTKVATWSSQLLSGHSLLGNLKSGVSVPNSIPTNWTDISFMFIDSNVPIDVRSWDVSKIKKADNLFLRAAVLMDLAPWKLESIESMVGSKPGSHPNDYSTTLRAWAQNLSADQYSWSPVMSLSSTVEYCNDDATLAAIQTLTDKKWAITYTGTGTGGASVSCSGTANAPSTFSVAVGPNGGGLVTTPAIVGPSDDYYAVTFLSATGSPEVLADNGPTCYILQNQTSCSVQDLPQGKYQISITRNGPTTSPSVALSTSARVTVGPAPSALPSAPTVSAIAGGVAISWDKIAYATDYLIEKLPAPTNTNCTITEAGGVTTANCTDLTQAPTYSFTVTPRNFGGSAPNPSARSLSVSPLAAPTRPSSAPTDLKAVTGTDSATVSWNAPSSGTLPFTYTLNLNGPGSCVVGTPIGNAVTAQCSGMTSGTSYTFIVGVTNVASSFPLEATVSASTLAGSTPSPASIPGSGSITSPGASGTSTPSYAGPGISKPSVDKASPNDTVSIVGTKLDLVTSIELGGVLVSFTIQSPTRLDMVIPAGLTAGLRDLVIFSGAGKLTSPAWITVVAASTATDSMKKLNVGTFKGFVAIYAKGYEGSQLRAKVAGKWLQVDSLTSGFVRILRKTIYVDFPIKVDLYIDGKLEQKLNIITR